MRHSAGVFGRACVPKGASRMIDEGSGQAKVIFMRAGGVMENAASSRWCERSVA